MCCTCSLSADMQVFERRQWRPRCFARIAAERSDNLSGHRATGDFTPAGSPILRGQTIASTASVQPPPISRPRQIPIALAPTSVCARSSGRLCAPRLTTTCATWRRGYGRWRPASRTAIFPMPRRPCATPRRRCATRSTAARRIIEELRRRFGEVLRPQEELDYIERLLKDY